MKENNLKVKVISSERMIHSMQPSLKKVLSLKVINDNGNAQTDALKQKWLIGASLAVAVAVVVLG